MSALVITGISDGNDPLEIRIADGRIAERGTCVARPPGVAIEDGAGALALPALVEGHCHLDKTLWGLPFVPHGSDGTLAGLVAGEKRLRRELDVAVATRAANLLRHCLAMGSTRLRSHVDVDPDWGLDNLHGVQDARDAVGAGELQIVAFPQSGVVTAPGTAALLEAAVAEGADAIGGLDPAGWDGDADGQLDILFRLAEKTGAALDIHLHDDGEAGCDQLDSIGRRAAASGLQGRVAVSHAWCLGQVDRARMARTAGHLAAGGVAIVTTAPGSVPMPPVHALAEAGVTVVLGNDNIRDAWSPLGDGDMLRRAQTLAANADWRDDADLDLAFERASAATAEALGFADAGIAPGQRADLVLVDAASVAEAVAACPPRRLVVADGRIVARDGIPCI